MIGLLTMLISIFFIIGGLYLGNTELPPFLAPGCLILGLVLFAAGVIFYRVIKSE